MRTNNRSVGRAWANGQSAESHNGNLHTDGKNLYSYRMLIGVTLKDGSRRVLGVRGKGHSYSATTSQHVGIALRSDFSAVEITPIHTRSGWSGWREFPQEILDQRA